jgi:nitric oxide reductase subunit B
MATEPAQSAPSQVTDEPSSERLIGRGWIQGVALVMIFGFFVLGILAYRTYTAAMPMPGRAVTESGQTLFTGEEITRGQQL